MTKERMLFLSLRISLGFIFLWAFFDKFFGLGFATAHESAWISGGSPTTGYLLYATHGPFATWFQMLAGKMWVDVLFMAGLFCVGVGLVFGIARRATMYAGIAMLSLMYLSAFQPKNNPILDEHIVYILCLILLGKKGRSD